MSWPCKRGVRCGSLPTVWRRTRWSVQRTPAVVGQNDFYSSSFIRANLTPFNLRNDWITAPVRTDLLFSEEPDEVWRLALESVGVDPAQLPAWTPQGDGGEAPLN